MKVGVDGERGGNAYVGSHDVDGVDCLHGLSLDFELLDEGYALLDDVSHPATCGISGQEDGVEEEREVRALLEGEADDPHCPLVHHENFPTRRCTDLHRSTETHTNTHTHTHTDVRVLHCVKNRPSAPAPQRSTPNHYRLHPLKQTQLTSLITDRSLAATMLLTWSLLSFAPESPLLTTAPPEDISCMGECWRRIKKMSLNLLHLPFGIPVYIFSNHVSNRRWMARHGPGAQRPLPREYFPERPSSSMPQKKSFFASSTPVCAFCTCPSYHPLPRAELGRESAQHSPHEESRRQPC